MFKNYKISPDERKLFARSNSTDLYKNNLKGKVKTVIVAEIKNLDNSVMQFMPFASKQLFEISEFNVKGEMVSYKEIYKGDIQQIKKEYIYNINDHLEEELIYDEDDELIETVTFKHNQQGLMIEEFRSDYDILLNAFYDEANLLNRVTDKSESQGYGEKVYIISRETNNKDNISTIETFHEGELTNKSLYKYDIHGNVTSVEHLDDEDELISKETIEYDDKNNISKLTTQNKRRTTEYSYKYEYDNFGNWVKLEFYVNGEFDLVSKRQIHYY